MQEDWGKAQEVQSNWFKFEKVGDRVMGTLLGKEFKRSTDPTFPDQWVYTLRAKDGTEWFVAISAGKAGTIQRLNSRKIGEMVGIEYEKEIPPQKKGFKAAKALRVVSFGMDENFDEFGEATPVEEDPFAKNEMPEDMSL